MIDNVMQIAEFDDELWAAMGIERRRQEDPVELIVADGFSDQ